MLFRILALTLLVSLPAFADECAPTVVDPNVLNDLSKVASRMNVECPNSVNVTQLCNAVSDQLGESNPTMSSMKYQYQRLIFQAACVEAGDQPSVIQAKVQNFWNRFHDQLNCTQLGFSIRNGSLLKLAVERDSREFVNDAVRRWKVNLNHVDPVDNKTVLDYIESEMQRQRGSTNEAILQRYFTIFRNNGAKFKREI